jgi:small GTP-binding protein
MSRSVTYQYKVVVLGDGGVGKTTLILRYTEKRFRENYIPTIGVQWTVKEIDRDGNHIKLLLWDLAGQAHFKSVRRGFYEGSNAAIIVFDVTDLESLNHVGDWLQELQNNCESIPCFLLGNKIDLVEERKITRDMVAGLKMPYFETSAKTGENVLELFNSVITSLQKGNSCNCKI